MQLNFTKMHGLGSDFVVFDAINQAINLTSEQIRFIANRRLGIGCDQLLLVEQSDSPDADFRYRIFNADGGEVEQCGNGARCFAKFVREKGLTDKTQIPVITNTGLITLHVLENGEITVNMGTPELEPEKIPFVSRSRQPVYHLELDGKKVDFGVVSMGNPHAIIEVDDTLHAPVESLGPALQNHSSFPNQVNVGFMQVVDENNIYLRVYERGAGETQACGTGACAAVVFGILRGLLKETVNVSLPGGQLSIQWQGENMPVMMTGSATSVFNGTITF